MPEVQKSPSLNPASRPAAGPGGAQVVPGWVAQAGAGYPSAYLSSTASYCGTRLFDRSNTGFSQTINICTGSYRYGFNGMEKDDEVKGSGNSYTTDFRMLDVRIGRWWSIDPVVHAFNSPYCIMDNRPIVINDLFGNDGRVTIQENKDGGGTITYESTIWVFGNGAENAAKRANEHFKTLNNSGIYYDENGNKWNVVINVTYKVSEKLSAASEDWKDGEDHIESAIEPNFCSGDNFLAIGDKAGRSIGLINRYGKDGGIGVPGKACSWLGNSGDVNVHESFHALGFMDNRGGATDISRNSLGAKRSQIDNVHFADMGFMLLFLRDYYNKSEPQIVKPNDFIFKAYFDQFFDPEFPNYVWQSDYKFKSPSEIAEEQKKRSKIKETENE